MPLDLGMPHGSKGELFGLEVRGLGTSLSTATNWAGSILIGSTYLSLMAKITPSGAFGFYAGLCLLGWIFVLACFPETAGLGKRVKGNISDIETESYLARHEEKAQSMLYCFREAQATELGLGTRADRRPKMASACKSLRECER
ncbi:hypothetical protein C0989_011044 [Termitomyces sp. Mn162]|nr:hypothetical protein C0989_011044 [Termitomyces sp. Mn162]